MKAMSVIRKIRNIATLPLQIIHEFIHIAMIYLTFEKFEGVRASCDNYKEFAYSLFVDFSEPKSKFKAVLIYMGPFLLPIATITLAVLFTNMFTILLCVYVLPYRRSYPSETDFIRLKYHGKTEEYQKYLDELERQMLENA